MKDPKRMKFDSIADSGVYLYHHEANLEYACAALEGADLLNIGCWTGDFEQLATGLASRVTGLDIEEKALDVARKRNPTADFVCGSALDIPFPDKRFDVVTLFAVIEHLPVGSEQRALDEIFRVLKPGGYFVLSTPAWNLRSRLMDPAYLLTGHRHYRSDELAKMVEEAGFTVIGRDVLGAWIYVFDYLTFYVFKYIVRTTMPHPRWWIDAFRKDTRSRGFGTLYLVSRRNAVP